MIDLLVGMVMTAAVAAAAVDTAAVEATPITLEQALQIALSENVSVKVADKEIERSQYAKKGTYASLFPQLDLVGSYQRTIKRQRMYIDIVMPGAEDMKDGMEVGRWNNWTGGLSLSMPLVNAQLWKSLKISGEEVELAVEKARSSRLETVTQVKNAYYAVLLAKQVFEVYRQVYENALANFERTQKKYNVQKASELDLTRSKANLASAIPNVYDSESSIILALWQLKAVMGVDLDANYDVVGTLDDYSAELYEGMGKYDVTSLEYNTTMRQLAIQAEELADNIKMQKAAYLPSLAVAFSYAMNATDNTFVFSQYRWSPYSYVGLSLNIPIFSGGKRLNNVRQAKVQVEELALQTSNTERQLKIAMRQYLNTMETNMKSFSSSLEAVETARKAYDIAAKSYNVGRSTLTDLNDAQLVLVQAQLSVSQTIFSYLSAKSELEQMIGNDFIEK